MNSKLSTTISGKQQQQQHKIAGKERNKIDVFKPLFNDIKTSGAHSLTGNYHYVSIYLCILF